MTSGFDRLARPYRWMEYLTFGRALERCRCMLLSRVAGASHALLLGDGDGRFAAALLRAAPRVHISAVDSSRAMLHALDTRCGSPARVTTYCQDLVSAQLDTAPGTAFDLVVSHFLLDCLDEPQIDALVRKVRPRMKAHAQWLVSEFHIPNGPMWLPGFLLVKALYVAFRIMTGLRVQQLPRYGTVLEANGFTCTERLYLLRGLLVTEAWHLASQE